MTRLCTLIYHVVHIWGVKASTSACTFQLSFMSVPTAQLRDLHLSGGMPPHTRSGGNPIRAVRERAIVVRDILSSFKEGCLPSEYMPDVYQNILEKTSIDNDPRSHVTQGDLHATLFRLAAYYEEAYPCVHMMQSDAILSRIYCEKLEERFKALFTKYDQLAPTSTNPDPQGEVTNIIQKLRDYYKDAIKDRSGRRRRESSDESKTLDIDRRFASMLIIQLQALCKRSKLEDSGDDEPAPKKPKMSSKSSSKAASAMSPKMSSTRASLVPAQTSPRATQSQSSYLFEEILGKASAETGFFALDLLESCSPESLEELQQRGLRELLVLLGSEGASRTYRERFGNLVTQEENEQ